MFVKLNDKSIIFGHKTFAEYCSVKALTLNNLGVSNGVMNKNQAAENSTKFISFYMISSEMLITDLIFNIKFMLILLHTE